MSATAYTHNVCAKVELKIIVEQALRALPALLPPPYYTLLPELESSRPNPRVHPSLACVSTNQRRGGKTSTNESAAGSLFLAPDKMAPDLLVVPVLRVW